MHGDVKTKTAAAAGEADPASVALRATCWGTRGSIPSPGPATAGFGGNTPCVEIRGPDGRCLIFDAGTGIRVLGDRLSREPDPTDVDLFVTHFHWDHIQGMPFFAPLHTEGTTIRIHAARQGDLDIEPLLRQQMGPVYFPVPYEALAATLSFEHLGDEPWRVGGMEVGSYRVRHPAHTYGYRTRTGGASIAYIPDNELVGSSYAVDGPDWYPGLVRFLEGVDVLFHDAVYTDEEYVRVEGWGHSTFRQAVKLAEDAGAKRLYFFHHAPDRTDADLLRILEETREEVERRGSRLELGIAAEGEEILVPGETP